MWLPPPYGCPISICTIDRRCTPPPTVHKPPGYDDNGSLIKTNGQTTHTYDRANRLLSYGGSSYAYDGQGNRVSQTVDSVVTQYLLDVQPGLATVLAATTGQDTTRYLHGPLGQQSQHQPDDSWAFPIVDGLGSVCGVVNEDLSPLESRQYTPYGEEYGTTGSEQTAFGFTGEPVDANGLVHLRARCYDPGMGRFPNLDPSWMEQNLYQFAIGNPVNFADPSGQQTTLVIVAIGVGVVILVVGGTLVYMSNPAFREAMEDVAEGLIELGEFTAEGITYIASGCWTGLQSFSDWLAEGYRALEEGIGVEGGASLYLNEEVSGITGEMWLEYAESVVQARGNTPVYEFQLRGFDKKVGTLAEHLAKLLEHDVAGYPPSDPNPYRDPDRGWCNTIRRIIQQIDRAGYSERQLARDLERAGFTGGRWLEIVDALNEVIRLGLCDDYWPDDFNGGSLAYG